MCGFLLTIAFKQQTLLWLVYLIYLLQSVYMNCVTAKLGTKLFTLDELDRPAMVEFVV